MSTVNEKMTALADEVRELSGTTTTKSIDAMTSDVGAANTEISEQTDLIAQITSALEGKAGGSGGVELPELTNPASASDILSGKEAIDKDGNKITGNIATVTQAIPSVTINGSGLITATATQSAGYVSAGTETGTRQLATQAEKTITPSTSSQTAVASGRYTTGVVTVAGDANLKAENIAEGVSIFGVTGTHSGGGSVGANVETCTVNIAGDGEGMVYYTSCINGQIDVVCIAYFNGEALNNVVCGSACTFINNKTILEHSVSSGEVKYRSSVYLFYKTPISGNTSAIVTIYND